ncbi:hypothetical protein AV530_017731 [Patagioenas fasciata monilis]|uniref:Uncharacterized protein n=1 Tax=Patagioenas fasciata monilis TaxID=372326 RepID=A0A1V4KVL1_PATFA|nr:hypothetical protein AV530_017731 [Patagioenas fasciata monilis]
MGEGFLMKGGLEGKRHCNELIKIDARRDVSGAWVKESLKADSKETKFLQLQKVEGYKRYKQVILPQLNKSLFICRAELIPPAWKLMS